MPFLPVGLETASEAPGRAQTGPCRAFLRSAVHPAPHPVSLDSYLCFTLHHLLLFWPLLICILHG